MLLEDHSVSVDRMHSSEAGKMAAGQWGAGRCWTASFQEQGHGLICSICWSLCHKTCYHGLSQATNTMLPNRSWGRRAHGWLSQTSTKAAPSHPDHERQRQQQGQGDQLGGDCGGLGKRNQACRTRSGNSRDVEVVIPTVPFERNPNRIHRPTRSAFKRKGDPMALRLDEWQWWWYGRNKAWGGDREFSLEYI